MKKKKTFKKWECREKHTLVHIDNYLIKQRTKMTNNIYINLKKQNKTKPNYI